MKHITITDVAQRAGVSKSTVSHALSGKRPISSATRQRVQAAVDALGYQPNPVAQRLAGSATRTIGCVLPLFQPQISALEFEFINSAATVLGEADYAFLLLTQTHPRNSALDRLIAGGMADGLIVMQILLDDARIERLRNGPTPFLMIGRCARNEGLAYVDSDIAAGLADTVEHLAQLGHKSIAFLHQDAPNFGYVWRAQQGFARGCQTHGLEAIMQPCKSTQDSGATAMQALLQRRPDVTAVIVWHDVAAIGAIRAAEDQGRTIPETLSVVCINPASPSELTARRITLLDIHAQQLAVSAARSILNSVATKPDKPHQELILPTLIPGASTTSPATLA